MKASDFIEVFLKRLRPNALDATEGGKACLLGGASGIVISLAELYDAGLIPKKRLLSWMQRLDVSCTGPLAFEFPDLMPSLLAKGLMSGVLGPPYARAYAGAVLGNAELVESSVREFSKGASDLLGGAERLAELWGGAASFVLATKSLETRLGDTHDAERKMLASLRVAARKQLIEELSMPVEERPKSPLGGRPYLGMAHGIAGELYALLASGGDLPDHVIERLDALAANATIEGDLVAWPAALGGEVPSSLWPTYCNGTPGMLELWSTAFEKTGNKTYLELAQKCAITTFGLRTPVASLCCGVAGQAVALIRYGQKCDDPKGLKRGQTRLRMTFAMSADEPGLLKGDAGIAFCALDSMRRRPVKVPLLNLP